jgi:acetyl esterase/lipase
MASVRIRLLGHAIRLTIRRRSWGPSAALVDRARKVFGVPRPWRAFRTRGVTVAPGVEGIPGEWVLPPGTQRATVLYLHGGGYVACSPGTHRPITAALARLTPARVFALDYRLAPEHAYPAALEDAVRGYRSLLTAGAAPAALAVAGDSAGGGLALALLLRLRDLGEPLPACAVLFSPWTDLAGTGPSIRANDGRDDMFRPENIPAFAAAYAPERLWRDPLVSPVYGDLAGLPPLHLQVGAEELLLDDAVRVHERALAARGRSELLRYQGAFHDWHLLDGLVPEARDALAAAAGAIRELTR